MDGNVSLSVQAEIAKHLNNYWTAIKFSIDIHDSQKMLKCLNNCHLTFTYSSNLTIISLAATVKAPSCSPVIIFVCSLVQGR